MATNVPRPTGVTVMGYLNIIVGLLMLVCCLPCSGAGLGMFGFMATTAPPPPPPGQPKPPDIAGVMKAVDAAHPTAKWAIVVQFAAAVVLTITLTISGFGMLKLKPSGRSLGLFTAIGLTVYFLASLGWTFVDGNAATAKFAVEYDRAIEESMESSKQNAPNAPPPPAVPKISTMMNPATMAASNVISTIFYLAYPLALLGVLLSKDAREAFAAAARGSADAPPS